MRWHFIEGEAGCAYAVEHGCVAVIVDALRASATAAMLFDAGALEIIVVEKVATAFEAKKVFADALLFGERGGLAPEGFDYGNSPRTVGGAKGRQVIFTTTTGAGRIIQAWGARAIYMGTTLNASAVARAAVKHAKDVVLIPAGLAGDPTFNAQEDRVAAALIAMMANATLGEGRHEFVKWRERVTGTHIGQLFAESLHATKLRVAGLEDDIAFCAQIDITTAVPKAIARNDFGVVVQDARRL